MGVGVLVEEVFEVFREKGFTTVKLVLVCS